MRFYRPTLYRSFSIQVFLFACPAPLYSHSLQRSFAIQVLLYTGPPLYRYSSTQVLFSTGSSVFRPPPCKSSSPRYRYVLLCMSFSIQAFLGKRFSLNMSSSEKVFLCAGPSLYIPVLLFTGPSLYRSYSMQVLLCTGPSLFWPFSKPFLLGIGPSLYRYSSV